MISKNNKSVDFIGMVSCLPRKQLQPLEKESSLPFLHKISKFLDAATRAWWESSFLVVWRII